jgi:hypothetical protein
MAPFGKEGHAAAVSDDIYSVSWPGFGIRVYGVALAHSKWHYEKQVGRTYSSTLGDDVSA